MKDLLDKIGSYNIFNHLLPGILFAVFVDTFTSLRVLQKDIVVGVFVYYFLGSVVSRVGSILVEPLLLKVGFIKFAQYEDFVKVSKADPKLEILSEANNTYRTISALMLCVGVVGAYDYTSRLLPVLRSAAPIVCIVGIFTLYLLAYKKQTAYISNRIEANKS